jgi:hypothetical protein
VVEDAFGEPAAGAEVFAGAEIVPGVAAILQPCGKTDEDGRFELTGAAESGQIVAAARRAPHEPWTTVVAPSHDKVLVEVDALVQLAVNVRDLAGKPQSGARVQVTPVSTADNAWGIQQVLVFLPRRASAPEVFREVEPGRYVNASLATGVYDVTARVAGLAPVIVRKECLASVNELALVCTPGHALDVTVTDAATREPVPGARASVLRVSETGLVKLAAAKTDAAGLARLGPLPDALVEEPTGFMPNETMLLVKHPQYGDHSTQIEPGTTVLAVELRGGGALAGRVHWGGAIPTVPYMLTAEFRGTEDGFVEAFTLPRFTVTDLEGGFRIPNMKPGKHNVELVERFLHQDPLGMIDDDFDVPTLHRQEVQIRDGETTELVIDLTPSGRGATARVVGHVRLFGRNLADATVRVRGNESVSVQTDAYGRFETPPFSVQGTARISVSGDVPLAGGRTRKLDLHSESVQLQNEDVHEIALDLHPLTVRAEVAEAGSGAPIEAAQVQLEAKEQSRDSHDDSASTGPSGEVELLVLAAGDYVLTASAEGYGSAKAEVSVPAEGLTATTTLRLPRAVPCAGRVALAPGDVSAEGPGFAFVQVRGKENGSSEGSMLRPPDYSFELEGLAPGEYQAWIFLNGQRSEERAFVLGPDGDRDLVLPFVPAVEDD